jgi:YegS/Rv2252/BmrU family lipid kinase
MSENKKVLFIINRFSGGVYRPSIEGRIIDFCALKKIECSIEFTQARGHAIELARNASQSNEFTAVFAVGGDGTVNEVAQGLVGTKTPMGILPNGSGNGLARHLQLPMDFKRSLELIGSQEIIDMDTFLVNGVLSVNVSGVGFDGHVASLFGKNGMRGFFGYSKLVIKEFLSFHEFDFEARLDDKKVSKKSFIVALANSSQFGNNAKVAPQASVCDEWLDVCFVRKVPILQSIGFGYNMFTGQLNKSQHVEIVKAKQIQLSFSKPMAFHIDGETQSAASTLDVKIQPASLRMLVIDNHQKSALKKYSI